MLDAPDEPLPKRVSGADLPEEILKNILRAAAHQFHESPPWYRLPSQSIDIHDFASLALVSRYFAAFCRPILFKRLKLRNRRHVARLIKLLGQHPLSFGGPLSAFVREIHISPDEEEEFCTHRALMTIIPRMQLFMGPTPSNIHLKLSGSGVLPVLTPGHSNFPRTLPSSLYLPIRQVHLRVAHFDQGEDLLRRLSHLRHACQAELTSITCRSAPTPAIVSRFLLGPLLRRVSGYDCESTCFQTVFPAMLNGYLADAHPLLPRDGSEHTALADIVMAAHKLSMDIFSGWSSEWSITRDSKDFTVSLGEPRHVYDWAGLRITLCTVQHSSSPISSGNTEQYNCIIAPEFSPGSDKARSSILSLDFWKIVAGHLSRLRHLRRLRFEFARPREMQAFVVAIYPVLNTLHASGRYLEFCELGSGWNGDAPTAFQRYGAETVIENLEVQDSYS